MTLKKHFITVDAPFVEGSVYAFEQTIGSNDINKATLRITALGVFCAFIDGQKVGNEILAPGYTYYPKDLHYREYDVSEQINNESVLRIYLGQGWYCGRFTFENKTQNYGQMPAVSWEIEIETTGGLVTHYSDDKDVMSIPSPYKYAGLYDGEIYSESEKGTDSFEIKKYEGPIPEIIEKGNVCVRKREEVTVRDHYERNGKTILDFGQNFAGIIEIDPSKMNGNTIVVRHGEILDQNGDLYTLNLRQAKQTIVYTKGQTLKKYTPEFTYMGFRYVEVSGVEYVDGLITAYSVYSDMERTGWFKCENGLVQKLYENQIWGQKSNYVELPTDCPQRDERMGYTGDGHVFAETGAFNFDTSAFWDKFLKDIRYSQSDSKDGYVTPTVPALPGRNNSGFMSMLGWGNCVCIVPEMLYNQFGDIGVLERQYDSMRAFADCEIGKMGGLLGKKDLWIAPSLGDWLALGKDIKYMALHNGPVSNAFLVNDMRIMTWAAHLLGKEQDEKKYSEQYQRSKAAYIKAFIKDGEKMKDNYQGAYVMALRFVVDHGELWDKLFGNLVANLRSEGMQTGFFATEHLLPLLCDNGEEKLAFDLLLSEKCPGWMYQIKRGATTTWERWDAIRDDGNVNETKMATGNNMVSFNHYSFGSVGKFYYKYILGISPLEPGYRKIRIAPHIDDRIGSFEGSYESRSGKIFVKYDSKKKSMFIDTPSETEICINGTKVLMDKGKCEYSV